MNYLDQLKDERWIKKRDEIFERDQNTCKICNRERPKFLNFNLIFGFKSYDEMVKEQLTPSILLDLIIRPFGIIHVAK
jgi:hypothetical protein